jgi:hypothetical protein
MMPDDEVLVRNAVANAGARGRPRSRWVAVLEVLAVGSTTAYALCQRFGFDPDETVPLKPPRPRVRGNHRAVSSEVRAADL